MEVEQMSMDVQMDELVICYVYCRTCMGGAIHGNMS